MSLHYLVNLQMLIGHVLPLGWYRKKLQNLFHLDCGPYVYLSDLNPVDCRLWEYCKRRCTKYTSLI